MYVSLLTNIFCVMHMQVRRTASRPLPSGAVTATNALVFLGAQLSAGLAVLVSLNPYAYFILSSRSLQLERVLC